MRKMLTVLAMTAGMAAANATAPALAQDAPFYEDEQLTLLVPFGPGGGTDVWARFMVKYLQEHIEGSPTVLVENRPGGGSITGVNHYAARVDPDGYTALVTSGSSILPYLLGQEIVRFDLADFRPLAANPVGAVFYVSPSTGLESAEDLVDVEERFVYGGISPQGADLVMLMIFDLLDMDVQSVMGFDGKGSIRVAYERGEVNTDYQVTPAYLTNVQPLVDSGDAIPLFTFGILDENGEVVADPAFPDLPTVKDVYQMVHGEEPSGLEWEAYQTFLAAGFGVQKILWVKQDTPQEAVDALQAGLADIAQDPEFKEEGAEIIGDYDLMVGDAAVAAARGLTEASDEVIQFGQDFLEEKGY